MSVFKGLDGQIKLFSATTAVPAGVSRELEVLFCDMTFSGPFARSTQEERLIMNRGTASEDTTHNIKNSEASLYEPMSFSFGCWLDDTARTHALVDWLSGCTTVNSIRIYGWETNNDGSSGGGTSLHGITVPAPAVTTKHRYRVQIGWERGDAGLFPGEGLLPGGGIFPGEGGRSFVLTYDEVYFDPKSINVTEQENRVVLGVAGQIYGDISIGTNISDGTDIME